METEGRCSTYRNVTQVYKASSFDFHVQSHGKHDCHMKKKDENYAMLVVSDLKIMTRV